jgi:hypothetical protein
MAIPWREDEWLALIELYDRYEGAPPMWAFEELSRRLRAEAPEAARDKSYRSTGGVAQQFAWIRLLARQDPRAVGAPPAARYAYLHYRRHGDWSTGSDVEDEPQATGGLAADRQALIRALAILQRMLAELVASPGLLPDELRGVYLAAWTDIEERQPLRHAMVVLQGPAVDDLLAAQGLVGPQREAKTRSIESADETYRRRRSWKP